MRKFIRKTDVVVDALASYGTEALVLVAGI